MPRNHERLNESTSVSPASVHFRAVWSYTNLRCWTTEVARWKENRKPGFGGVGAPDGPKREAWGRLIFRSRFLGLPDWLLPEDT
jgi:hypothetical protein